MSTKIYNGYIAKLSIPDLLFKFKTLVKEFEKIKNEEYSKFISEQTIFEIDRRTDKKETVDQLELLRANHKKNEEKIKETVKKGFREPELDFSAMVNVHFLKKNTTLLLFYCEHEAMIEFWQNLDFIKEYNFQNQVDPPEEISAYNWRKRETNWDLVLGNDPPVKSGYGFTFTIL